jgi:hypothetical protein
MIERLVFFAALALAPIAAAQEPAPATPEQIAAARAEADAIIARSEAGEFFENATTSETPQARHVRSGMVCSFTAGDPRNTIAMYPVVADGPPRGDDVSCGAWWGPTYVSSYATRYPQQYSAEQLFAGAVQDIRSAWQNVSAVEGEVRGATIAGQEPPLVGVFNAERQGRPMTTVVVLRNIGEWSFKVRASGEPTDPEVTVAATLAFGAMIPGGWEIVHGDQ